VTRENINSILSDHGFSGDIGLLSIDIDGNDYWVWEAAHVVNPAIVICEYNAVFGDIFPVTTPYDPTFSRTKAHHSNLYFGCSIQALVHLGERKGYKLIGGNRAGCNAFFIRSDLYPTVESLIAEKYPHASQARESRDRNGRLTFLSGMQRYNEISHLPVNHLDTNETLPLRSLGPAYSERWLKEMAG
jgi:hypothetical protein